jgi:hypothetical protein
MSEITWTPNGMTREIKARNIFGLSTCRFTRLWGQVGEDNSLGDHLAVMPSIPAGIHATIDELKKIYLHLGNMEIFLPAFLGNGWSGDPLKVYGRNLAKIMKLPPFKPVSFKIQGDNLLRALALMENGDPCRNIPEGYFAQFIEEV